MVSMLYPCSECHRHVRDGELCPFCGSDACRLPVATGPVARRASAAALLLAGAISVAGCYGGPPADYAEPENTTTTTGDEEESEPGVVDEVDPESEVP
jgi:hypothetical protein